MRSIRKQAVEGEEAQKKADRVLRGIAARLTETGAAFDITIAQDSMVIWPVAGSLVVTVTSQFDRFYMAFNEVPFDADDEDSVFVMLVHALEGRLRVVSRMRGHRVFSASLELKDSEHLWVPIAGFGNFRRLLYKLTVARVACNCRMVDNEADQLR